MRARVLDDAGVELASRAFAAQTGGPSGARQRDPAGRAAVPCSLLEQIAFGAVAITTVGPVHIENFPDGDGHG